MLEKQKSLNGILIVDKPKGWTSHDVVAKLRNTLKIKKIGHGGTLDPEATGVLVLLLGSFTKKSNLVLGMDKEYLIDFQLGRSTTTGDEEGETVKELGMMSKELKNVDETALEKALDTLRGTIDQQVPWFSAVKVEGKKLYQLARGKSPNELAALDKQIERPVREIEVKRLEIERFEPGTEKVYPHGTLAVECSSGTYTRVLVEDLGAALEIPAYQTDLRRTRIGPFSLENSVTKDEFEDVQNILSKVIPPDHALQILSR